MREIKFRAWAKKQKRMVAKLNPQGLNLAGDNIAEYAPECIWMQYTNLKDKNGKEIYEGDVLRIKENGTKEIHDNVVVSWRQAYVPSFSFNNKKGAYWIGDGDIIEVIGNIYENPELLTK